MNDEASKSGRFDKAEMMKAFFEVSPALDKLAIFERLEVLGLLAMLPLIQEGAPEQVVSSMFGMMRERMLEQYPTFADGEAIAAYIRSNAGHA